MSEQVQDGGFQILEQLGGSKFIVMTGAKNFRSAAVVDLIFDFKGCKEFNMVAIDYSKAHDDYDMWFYHFNHRTCALSDGHQVAHVQASQLQEVFTRETGLATHL